MKKIIFSLIMLCCMTAAWAEGTGDGSKERPYSGEWQANELSPKLKIGDYLAYDCVIKDGGITVRDSRLGKMIVNNWKELSIGVAIGDSAFSQYEQYCKDNSLDERKSQSFIITEVPKAINKEIYITGYFSGTYTISEDDVFEYAASAEQMMSILKNNANANVRLTQDIYLSDVENRTFCNTFSGSLDGDGHTIYGSHDGTLQRTYLCVYSQGAIYKNLTFRNIRISNEDDENQSIITSQASNNCVFENITFHNVSLFNEMCNVGAVTAQANNCIFKNIKVFNSDFGNKETWLPEWLIEDYIERKAVGGVVGKAYNGCIFNNIEVVDCEFHGVYNLGGVVGDLNRCRMENAFVKGCFINAEGSNTGGIAGKSFVNLFTNCHVDDQTCIFCDGNLSGSEVGGIAGDVSSGSVIRNCINSALVAGDDDWIGGIAGVAGSSLIDHCLNTGILISIDGDNLDKVFSKYKSKSFGTPITTINYNGNEYKVQQLDEASKKLVDTNDDYVGGITGQTWNSTIKNSINYAPYYSKDDKVGGIVGCISGSWLLNCINAPSAIDGFPDAEDSHGGLIGYVDEGGIPDDWDSPIMRCLNLNGQKMIGEADDGGYSGSGNYSNSSSHSSIDNPITIDMVNSGYLAYLMNQYNANILNDKELLPWRQDLSGDSKTLPGFDPTLNVVDYDYLASSATITTAEQLRAFADKVNNGHNPGVAFLGADISYVDENVVHNPIGNRAHPFSGMFEGNGHTISGLQYHIYLDTEGVGLFGVVGANTYISNVIVDGTSAVTNANAGAAGIVGLVYFDDVPGDVFIKHCASNANVTANKHAGGILGRIMTEEDGAPNSKVYISDCYSTGIITAKEGNSGLLCGYMKDHGALYNCWSAGQLRTSNSNNAPYSNVNPTDEWEYLAGYNEKITISNCYAVNPGGNIDKWNDLDQHAHQKGVEKIANYKVADGTMAFYLNGHTNDVTKSLVWQQKIGTDAYPEFGNEGVYHTRNVSESSNGYGTLCLPYAVQSDDNIHYYTFSEATNSNGEVQLKFDYVEDLIPAGTPLLFRVRNTGENTFYNADGGLSGWSKDHPISPAAATWRFWGSFIDQTFYSPENIYYVSNGAIKNGTRPTIPAYRAYFEGPNINDLKSSLGGNTRVRIMIEDEDGETSSISLVELDGNYNFNVNENDNFRGKTYSLMGTEVGEGYRGIVIRNGKKVLRK